MGRIRPGARGWLALWLARGQLELAGQGVLRAALAYVAARFVTNGMRLLLSSPLLSRSRVLLSFLCMRKRLELLCGQFTPSNRGAPLETKQNKGGASPGQLTTSSTRFRAQILISTAIHMFHVSGIVPLGDVRVI